jgi:ethanolamine ammonia-lyase small subunit
MAMEDNIRLIVEQVLMELGKASQPAAGGSCPGPAVADNGNDGNGIEDLAKVDLQRYLQVPEPQNRGLYEEMKLTTPARIGVWRCGTRPLTDTWLRFRADHAVAQDSVLGEVPEEFPAKYNMVSVKSMCESKDEYLTRPDLGRKLDEESLNLIRSKCRKGAKLQIIVADGLSSNAVEANIPNLLPAMLQGLEGMKVDVGTPIFVKFARVAIMDAIGEELKPEAAIVLLGERPGLGTAESMSAYIGYNPRAGMVESERTVVSNIHKSGTPAAEAGAHLATLLKKILDAKASGVNLH